MKKNLIYLPLVVFAISLTSCGSSRKMAQNANNYQQGQQQQPVQQRPSKVRRTTEPCIALANENSGKIRAYGTATSYIEKTALNEAERDARNRMAAMMKVVVEGASQDYSQNATQNIKNSAKALSESIMTQFVAEKITNTFVIETSIYDLADGSIQVYVCLEMRDNVNSIEKQLDNTLQESDIVGIEFDRHRFIKSMSEGLENYKKENK